MKEWKIGRVIIGEREKNKINLKMLSLRCPWNTLFESSGVFGRIEGMEFRSSFLEVMAKVMEMRFPVRVLRTEGQGLWFRIVGIYAFRV